MLFKALSAAVYGIDANLIDVEVDYSGAVMEKDVFHTVGLPDAAVRESRDRVRAAIKNSGYLIPPTFITINLAPADIKKGRRGIRPAHCRRHPGRLWRAARRRCEPLPDGGRTGPGRQRAPVPGMLPIAILAREKGIPNLILPAANAAEAAVVEGVNVYPVSSLLDVLELLNTSVVGSIQREPFRVATATLLASCSTFRGLQGCARPADGQARARSGRGGQPQHSDDRAAGLGQNHAGQAAAFDPGAAHI
jgi:magnesium chelatase family protein